VQDDSAARRLALEVQSRSTRAPLFVREDDGARHIAEAMLTTKSTAAVVYKASENPRGDQQRFLYGLITMSDMCV
jgi:hypothetical protein